MHSEPVTLVTEPVSESAEQATSPMQHEAVVHEVREHQSFSPGQGTLEEEILDEDEAEPIALHAGYDDEFEDLEEETLEGAADLGTMIREMSIDHITSPADVEEGEEEFEEAEAEEAEFGESEESFADGDKPRATADDAEFFADTFREPVESEE